MSPFALPVAELKPALTGLGKVLNRQASLPVLSMIRLERNAEGRIKLTATDSYHFVSVRLDAPQKRPGAEPETLVVPFGELLAVTKSCGREEEVLVGRDGPNFVSIRYAIGSQYAEYRVETRPVEEFPEIPRVEGEPIPVPEPLRASLLQAFECASNDEARLVLNGAYLDVSQRECQQVVATDGRHLFSSNSFALPLSKSVIVPTHRFLQWREFHRDGAWQLRVSPGPERDGPACILLSTRKWRFITSELHGNYPNWRQVVPATSDMQCSFELEPHSVEQVVRAVQRLPSHDPINLSVGLEVTGDTVQLLAKTGTPEQWIRVQIPAVRITGKPVQAFLNRNYLLKALRFGLTRIELIDPMSPLRFSQGGRQMIAVPPDPARSARPQAAEPASDEPTDPGKPQERKPAVPTPGTAPPSPARTAPSARRPRKTTVNAGTVPTTQPDPAAGVEDALNTIDSLRETLHRGLIGLRELSGKLRVIRRELPASRSTRPSLPDTKR